jgi:hypothetical protein
MIACRRFVHTCTSSERWEARDSNRLSKLSYSKPRRFVHADDPAADRQSDNDSDPVRRNIK